MLFPIRQLIEGHDDLVSIPKHAKVREALVLMMEHDYSQLPVTNEDGNLVGIISEASIVNTYFHIDPVLSLLDLTVDHCSASSRTISPDSDIFEALNLLENAYAVVVVENQKPVGILTDYDTTHFFRDLSEGLIIVEDIEVTLRQYIESVFSDNHKMDAALMRAFKENKKDPSRPAREYEALTFAEHIQLIVTEHNWEKFADYFAPKELFSKLMAQVGDIRNQLAHFRGRLEPIQLNALVRGRDWLAARPKPATLLKERVKRTEIKLPEVRIKIIGEGKYDQFRHWLAAQRAEGRARIRLGFTQIEALIGQELPASARRHRSWWANDPATHSQAASWITAGWLIEDVNLDLEDVTFRKTNQALYYTFFSDLLTRLKVARPGIVQTQKASLQNRLRFSAGRGGVMFGWVLPQEYILMVELYIDFGDKDANKSAFDKLR